MENHIQPNVTTLDESSTNRNNDAHKKEVKESTKQKNIEAIRKRLNECRKGLGDMYAEKLVNGGYSDAQLLGAATLDGFEKVFKKDPIPIPQAGLILKCFKPREESKKNGEPPFSVCRGPRTD